MAFKYVNPGYAELLDCKGNTVNDTAINETNGVAFSYTGDQAAVVFNNTLTDIWISVSMNRSYLSGRISVNGNDKYSSRFCGIEFTNDGFDVYLTGKKTSFQNNDATYRKGKIVLHARSGANDGIIEVFFNGDRTAFRQGNVNNGDPFKGVWLYTGSEKNYFFNVIIADYDISHEEVVMATLTEPKGTWEGIGTDQIKATDVGQILTQQINMDDLKTKIDKLGANITITGVSLCARNVLFDSNKITALTGIVNNGKEDVYSETKTFSTTGTVSGISYVKNMTLNEIQTAKFSLKSAKV